MPAPSDPSSPPTPSMPAASSMGGGGWHFLVDENLPMSLVSQLIAAGHTAVHARDVGLGHVDDTIVFAYAQQHGLSIITIDKGLSNILQYPPPHSGIVSVRLPEHLPIAERVRLVIAGLTDVANQGVTTLANLIVIVMPGRVRVRHVP